MRLTRRGRRVVVALALAGATTAGATAQHWDPYARQLGACRSWDVPEDTSGTGESELRVVSLRAAGWFARQDDHAERLYAPACRARRP